jgi:hypothetical protein
MRPASIRGIACWVEEAELAIGRRVAVHEFPQRDDPYHEDLGRSARQLSLELILVGDDVIERAAQLEAAIEAPGPARLVHPWYGELDVVILTARSRISMREGRVARISITCQRAGAEPSPIGRVDSGQAVRGAADGLLDAVTGLGGLDLAGVTGWPVAATLQALTTTRDALSAALRAAGLGRALAAGEVSAWLGVLGQMLPADLVAGGRLVMSIVGLARSISGMVPGLGAGGRDYAGGSVWTPAAGAAWRAPARVTAEAATAAPALLAIAGLDLAPPPASAGTALAVQRASRASAQLAGMVRIAAAAELARVSSALAWESRDAAWAWREELGDGLSAAAETAAAQRWDGAWQATADVRAAALRDVTVRAAPLPRLRRITPAATLPAAVVAYRIDGDDLAGLWGRASDLTARNRVRHPGFVPGGRALEALTRE